MSIATLVPDLVPDLVPEPELTPARGSATDVGRARTFVGPLPATGSPVPLRRLPLPVLEPRAAVAVVEDDPAVAADQQVLDLGFRAGPRRALTASERTAPWDDKAEADLAAARQWASRFVQAAVEVATGVRPTGQLVRWASPDVLTLLERRAMLALRLARRRPGATDLPSPRARILVRKVHCCRVRAGVCEASAVVQDHDRTRAVALRVERFEGRWRATALELG